MSCNPLSFADMSVIERQPNGSAVVIHRQTGIRITLPPFKSLKREGKAGQTLAQATLRRGKEAIQ